MRDVRKEVVAVALARPKVNAVLGFFLFVLGVEVLAKAQNNDFPQFELKIPAREKHLVARDVTKDALVVFGKGLIHRNPTFAHRPTKLAGRFSKKAWTPSA
jgi:hypothetical protein